MGNDTNQERKTSVENGKSFSEGTDVERSTPTTCIETIGGDPATAIRLSFQIKVF